MTADQSLYNNLQGGYDPAGSNGAPGGTGAGAFDPTGGGLSGGLAGAASPNLGAGDLGASSAVSQALVPLATSVLSAPAGTLTKDRLVGDTADFLSSARARGLSDDQFGHVVRSAINFLTPFDDDTPDPVLRAATGQMLVNHLAAHGQVQAKAGGGGGDESGVGGGSPQPAQDSGPQPASGAPADGSDLAKLFQSMPYSSNPLLKGANPWREQFEQDQAARRAAADQAFRQHPNTLPGTPETLWSSDPGYKSPFDNLESPNGADPAATRTQITRDQLKAIMPTATDENIDRWLDPLNKAMASNGVDTPQKRAAFLAHVSAETGDLAGGGENLYYKTTAALHKAYGEVFADPKFAAQYLRNPAKLANFVYANNNGNGDEASGDGSRFAGRGALQVTGRSNYRAAGYENNPTALNDPAIGSNASGDYWNRRGLNDLSANWLDRKGFDRTTRLLNGKHMNKAQERWDAYQRARTAFGG